ncbi:MAG: protein kinase, partial [Lachnospiraceae bacterium]|nr:protein kinase [Lachnospiraceae bacterium]
TTPKVYQLKPGSVLDSRYDIVSVLGYGGFGVVYKAWDTNLQRTVAIKEFFPTQLLSRDEGCREATVFDAKNEDMFLTQKKAFLQEARVMAGFNEHPNIVHVFDSFEENNTAYFVMEYLSGKTVDEHIKEALDCGKVLSIDSAVHITRKVLNALKATHAKGIIHRDIKPQNIFVLNNGKVKLYDFGAARFEDNEEDESRLIVITPGYAPAEQYQTKSKQGAYTDIYALGAVLYEMLTGIQPEESIKRKDKDELELPSHINSKITPALESVIMRALAVAPEIRFQSAAEFDRALKTGRKVTSVKQEIKKRRRRRNRFVFALLSVLLVAFGYLGWQILDNVFSTFLAPVTLHVWVPAIETESGENIDATINLYNTLLEEFRTNHSHVTVIVEVKRQSSYAHELEEALLSGKGPDAFDSSLLGDGFLQYYAPIDTIYSDLGFDEEDTSDSELDEYYYLEKRKSYFEEIGKVPLLMNFSVLYTHSGNEDLPDTDEYQSFIDGQSDYIGSVLDYDTIQKVMAGKFVIKEELYSKDGEREGEFLNYWSINKKSIWLKREACGRLIHYLLSPASEEELSVNNNYGIPLNKEVYDEYMSMNGAFTYLTDQLGQARLR